MPDASLHSQPMPLSLQPGSAAIEGNLFRSNAAGYVESDLNVIAVGHAEEQVG